VKWIIHSIGQDIISNQQKLAMPFLPRLGVVDAGAKTYDP